MDDLTEQLKQYTPEFASSHFHRDGSAKIWGYTFAPPTELCHGETYTHFCFDALRAAEAELTAPCSPSKIILNERDEGERIEEVELDRKWKIAEIVSRIVKVPARLLLDKADQLFSSDQPTQQRLLVFEHPEGKISFGVSHKRVCRLSSENVHFMWTGEGIARYLGYSGLPVLIGLHGFERGQRFYQGLNEKLRNADFPGLRRIIPF